MSNYKAFRNEPTRQPMASFKVTIQHDRCGNIQSVRQIVGFPYSQRDSQIRKSDFRRRGAARIASAQSHGVRQIEYQLEKTLHRHTLPDGTLYTRTISPAGNLTSAKLTTVLADHLGSTDVLLVSAWSGSSWASPIIERQAYTQRGELITRCQTN